MCDRYLLMIKRLDDVLVLTMVSYDADVGIWCRRWGPVCPQVLPLTSMQWQNSGLPVAAARNYALFLPEYAGN